MYCHSCDDIWMPTFWALSLPVLDLLDPGPWDALPIACVRICRDCWVHWGPDTVLVVGKRLRCPVPVNVLRGWLAASDQVGQAVPVPSNLAALGGYNDEGDTWECLAELFG